MLSASPKDGTNPFRYPSREFVAVSGHAVVTAWRRKVNFGTLDWLANKQQHWSMDMANGSRFDVVIVVWPIFFFTAISASRAIHGRFLTDSGKSTRGFIMMLRSVRAAFETSMSGNIKNHTNKWITLTAA